MDKANGQAFWLHDGGLVSVIDLLTGAQRASLHIPPAAESLAYDASSGCLYAAAPREDAVFTLDARSGLVLTTTSVGPGPVALAVNPDRDRVYVACAGDGSVQVLDGDLRAVERVRVAGMPLTGLSLDRERGRLYLVHPIVPGRHGISELDESTLDRTVTWGGGADDRLAGLYGVLVDPATGLLFGADHGRLLAIDPEAGAMVGEWRDTEAWSAWSQAGT